MSIRFLDYRIIKVIFLPSNNLLDYLYSISNDDENILPLRFKPIFLEKEEEIFFVNFTLSILKPDENEDDLGRLEVEFVARFSKKDGITEEFIDSHFPTVNAPAIAYPFLRASINNFFISSGYDSVLLPTYNFTKHKTSS